MADNQTKPGGSSPLMATVTAIVEAMMGGEDLSLLAQRASPWKAAQREEMARGPMWRGMGWNRA